MKKLLLGFAIMLGLLVASPISGMVAAQSVDVFDKVCRDNSNKGAVCADKNVGGKNPLYGPEGIITKVINILSIVVGVAAVIMIMVGAFKFITSGDNPQEVTNAREIVIYAIVGLVVAASAQLIVRVFLSKVGT